MKFENTAERAGHRLPSPADAPAARASHERWCGGVGDRTAGIVSVFLLALASDRDFFIDSTWTAPLEVVYAPNAHDWRLTRIAGTPRGDAAAKVVARDFRNALHRDIGAQPLRYYLPGGVAAAATANMREWVPLMSHRVMLAKLRAVGLAPTGNRTDITFGEVASAVLGFLFRPTPALAAAVARDAVAVGRGRAWGVGDGRRAVAVHLRVGSGIEGVTARMSGARQGVQRYARCAAKWAATPPPCGARGAGAPPCRVTTLVVFTDTEDARNATLFRASLPADVDVFFLNSTTCHVDQDTQKAACRADRAAVLVDTYAEWHTLAEVARDGGIVMGRSGFPEMATLLHAGTRRYKLPYDYDACVGGAPPGVELGQGIGTPLAGVPFYDLQSCAPGGGGCRRREL